MKLSELKTIVSNEPGKYAAMAIVVLSSCLFILQIMSFFRWDGKPNTNPPLMNKHPQIMITNRSALFSKPLFGDYIPNLATADIKNSTLDIELIGIMYSVAKKKSQVLIKDAGGNEQSYGLGDTLPGGAVIRQIGKNRIIVLYNGSLESLSLPKNELIFDEPAKPLIKE